MVMQTGVGVGEVVAVIPHPEANLCCVAPHYPANIAHRPHTTRTLQTEPLLGAMLALYGEALASTAQLTQHGALLWHCIKGCSHLY